MSRSSSATAKGKGGFIVYMTKIILSSDLNHWVPESCWPQHDTLGYFHSLMNYFYLSTISMSACVIGGEREEGSSKRTLKGKDRYSGRSMENVWPKHVLKSCLCRV